MKNIIFLINIKNPHKPGRTDVYDLSIDSWKRWSQKNNSDVFVLEEPIVDISEMSPIFFRHYIFDLLDPVSGDVQICTVDADTIIHPDCPDFFKLTDGRYTGVHNDGDYDWIIRSIENYQYHFGTTFTKPFDIWKYINSGFMVTNKKYQFVHEALLEFYWKNQPEVLNCQRTYGVGTDQPLINLMLNELGVDVKILPYQFNMQDLSRKNILSEDMQYLKIPGIYHFNAIAGGPEKCNYWITKTHKTLYGG